MATDYDSPRKTDDELTEDSLQELQARRMDKSSTAIDIDPDDVAESLELPGVGGLGRCWIPVPGAARPRDARGASTYGAAVRGCWRAREPAARLAAGAQAGSQILRSSPRGSVASPPPGSSKIMTGRDSSKAGHPGLPSRANASQAACMRSASAAGGAGPSAGSVPSAARLSNT